MNTDKHRSSIKPRRTVLPLIAVALATSLAMAQQVADPSFDARVTNPAYTKDGPRVLFDEAHNNFHTASGRYKAFADLITNDGYRITPSAGKFTAELLAGYDVLVISNALGAPQMDTPEASEPAFTAAEADAVRDWVRAGGALLLIADHAPMGAANRTLGGRFDVEMRDAFTHDPANRDPQLNSELFTRENGLLGDHAITRGRDAAERVNRVCTFTGQSLKGPAESFSFLTLAATAVDYASREASSSVPAAGRSQGLARGFGKGRVVVMGEAAMLSAQLAGPNQRKFGGLNQPAIDNRQLALNIMHWLSRALN